MQQVIYAPKTTRFEARITEEQKALFLQAAALGGHRTLSDFIVTSAQEKAMALVKEYEILQLSSQDRGIFMDALLNPPAPNEKLQKAVQKYIALAD